MEMLMSLRGAILGLLNKEPMNGYAIKTLFDEAVKGG
jgi:DNA-binding PadR family transcriptional regulator